MCDELGVSVTDALAVPVVLELAVPVLLAVLLGVPVVECVGAMRHTTTLSTSSIEGDIHAWKGPI